MRTCGPRVSWWAQGPTLSYCCEHGLRCLQDSSRQLSTGTEAQRGLKQGWDPVPAQRRLQLLISINSAHRECRSTPASVSPFKKRQILIGNILTANVGQLGHVIIHYWTWADRRYPWDGPVLPPLMAIYGRLRQLLHGGAFSSFSPFVPNPKSQPYTYYKTAIFLRKEGASVRYQTRNWDEKTEQRRKI